MRRSPTFQTPTTQHDERRVRCVNKRCRWWNEERAATPFPIGKGLFVHSAIRCECGWDVEDLPTSGWNDPDSDPLGDVRQYVNDIERSYKGSD